MPSYLAKVALLAALYFLAGKLGLSLAVRPGYATVIWPASGIVLGLLLAFDGKNGGRRLAPGVFVGSFLLNATVGHTLHDLPTLRDLLIAASIATGATVQALVGHALVVRWFGLPIRLRQAADVFKLLVLAVPLSCLISPTVGVASLYLIGGLPVTEIAENWFTWWAGGMFGVLVFLPLTLVLCGRATLIWRDRVVSGLHAVSLVLLVLPLGLTFFAWKTLSESSLRQSQAHFESLAREGEQALRARLAAYASATRGGAGIVQSSVFVSPEEWHTFVETLRLRDDYPGMLGLGWIERIAHDGQVRDQVRYLEPDGLSVSAGLILDQQPALREAAANAASRGQATLSRAISLGRDEDRAPGFLLLQPVYRADAPLDSAEQRRRAVRGFVFTLFQARDLVANLTPSQGRRMDVSLGEGAAAGARPVFSTRSAPAASRFSAQYEMQVQGSTWRLTWQSTTAFEHAETSGGAHFVLFGGLLFTGLFGVLLVVFGARRHEAEQAAGPLEQPWLLPLATFMLVACGSFGAYALLGSAEEAHISTQVENETRRLEAHLDRSVRARLQVVRRMAHRWSAGGGTPYVVWRNDARDLVRQIDGVEQIQWIGPDYHLHWSEGWRRSGWVASRDVRTDSAHAQALTSSAEQGTTYVSPPRQIAPGESVFEVFVPVSREGHFDGFISATFSNRSFFGEQGEFFTGKSFAFAVQYEGVTLFENEERADSNQAWRREGEFRINDRLWSFTVSPTRQFVDEQQTLLPLIVLICGVLIAFLSAFLVRYVLVARLKAARLQASTRALTESEERYELALRGMSVGLWDWNIITNAVFLSPRCRAMLGITSPDFAPSYAGFIARVHADDRGRLEKALFGHLKQQNAFDVEFRIRRNEGDYIWVHIYGQAQYDAKGFADRMAGSMQDITGKKQQEQELERSGAQLRMLVENVPAAVAMFDKEMRYLMTSRRWIEDYGLEQRDIVGMSHYDVFPEIRDMPRWIDIHRRALRGERFDIREDSWIRADGQKEWNQWAIHPWKNADGEVGGIVMFTEVITARKQAEAALRASEAMNRAAMDKAPIGKAMVDPAGRFLKVNPALCQLLGHSEAELLVTDFQSVTHPDDRGENLAHLRALLDGRTISFQMDTRYIHRDGRVIWVALSVSAVRRADGAVDFLVAQLQDITERRVLDRMKDDFAAVVGNELHAPLAALRESLGEIAAYREPDLPHSLQRQIESCRQHADRLGNLVAEMTDLEKIAAGQLRIDFKDERIAEITRHAVSVNESYSRIKLADIDTELTVYVDTARYVQVLANLLSNAARFSAPGSPIEVGAELRGDWVRIHVRDQGEGIPEEFRARIFGKFAHADRPKSGAGLGLYITRQLVEQMRGRIGFVSEPGSGTTFWVEFPRMSRGEQRRFA